MTLGEATTSKLGKIIMRYRQLILYRRVRHEIVGRSRRGTQAVRESMQEYYKRTSLTI